MKSTDKSTEQSENEAYVAKASKVDVFMGKLRHAKSQRLGKMVADKFIFDHFVGPEYPLDMFCMDGIEVYQAGRVPEELQDELQSK